MNKIVMATNNANKLREAREILAPLGIEVISQREAGADCEPEENGVTFAENAMIKAKAVYDIVKIPVFADDSGLCVNALDGRPGVYSARYAPKGQECAKLLDEMKDVPDENRYASFKCVIAYFDGDMSFTVSGAVLGKIGYEERGTNGFGYDPVFIPLPDCGRTMAELTAEEKNGISHRGAVLQALYEMLDKKGGFIMKKSDKELIKESYDYLRDLCDFLSDEYEYEFEAPATEEEINDWEKENKINIPSMLKEWLLLTKNCNMSNRSWHLFLPEIDETGDVLVGSFVGDGEYLYFSKDSGDFFTTFEGEVEEYDSFDSVLTYISVDLEEKAEELFGEDWLEEFENQ